MTTPDPNPESEQKITSALVQRVSERISMGMPLKIALAGEKVTPCDYRKHLSQHPELADLLDVAKQKFLQDAFNTMLEGETAPANFRWLIELVYKDVLGPDEDTASQKPVIAGLPNEILDLMREHAKRL
jgi:hypothetical protein